MVNTGGFNDSYGVNRGFASLQDERDQVKRSLQIEPTERSHWHPISMGWFLKWKNYVNFDNTVPEPRDPKEIENFHPGPIDNSPLKGNYGDELRRDILEGQDFVLLPKHIGERLFNKYNGGPQYPREAINVGSFYSPLIQINLFPIRVEMYHCDKKHPTPTRDLKSHFMIRYYVKTHLLENMIEDVKSKFSIDYLSDVRVWIRDPENKKSSNVNIGEKEETEVNEGTVSNKKQRVGRMLTADQVQWDGDWRFVTKLNKTLHDVLGTKECIEVILESAPRYAKDNEWPRFALLEGWKNQLRAGDMVDAQDRSKHWYESVIKDVDATGKLHVHFKGWGNEFDEVILPEQRISRIKPLHSESEDRSTWEEGDSVELNISEPDQQPVWLQVKIVGQDLQTDRILVQYSAKDKRENLAKLLGTNTKGGDDDAMKKKNKHMDSDPDSTDGEEDEMKGIGGEEEAKEKKKDDVKSDIVREWFDLYSDSICAMHTHIAKPKQSQFEAVYDSIMNRSPSYNTSSYSSNRGYYSRYDYSYEKNTKATPVVNGAVGLQNLGNTCFMNSILQCLSNTDILCNLFTAGNYKEQINYDNPLGHNGKVALSYGKLMKEIWSNAYSLVVPREFKSTIGEFRPQFAGTEQQDSQEFMNFLLDGLHEDLNRIMKKPHVQKIESKGRDDGLISSESWRRFLLRNDSEVVDHFFGQLKSHVTCVNCGNISVTFDEYSSLSLPIPIRNTKTLPIIVQLLPLGSPPLRINLEVEITAPMSQLKKLLIDRLIELGVILETSNSLSSSPVPPSNNLPPPAKPANDDGFEMVGETVEEGFEVIHNTNNNNNSNSNNIKSSSSMMDIGDHDENSSPVTSSTSNTNNSNLKNSNNFTTTANNNNSNSKYDQYHFHFATLFGSRSTVFKNYNASEAASSAISSFAGKSDVLAAFQLEHDVPDIKYAYSSYSYYSSLSNKPAAPVAKAYAVDVAVGSKGSYSRIDLSGYPCRFSLSKENPVTNHEVHLLIHQYIRRFLSEDLVDNTVWPYDLLVTNSYASQVKREVEDNNSLFEPPQEGSDLLVVCWTGAGLQENMIDLDQVKFIREVGIAKSGSSSSKNSNNNSYGSSYYDIDEEVNNDPNEKKITVYDCLDKFIEREQLNETETLYCSKCKQHLAPIKKMDIYSSPDILIVHLKRFQFIPGQYFVHREKINDVIDFPINGLDLSKYVIGGCSEDSPPVYDLYGVSHHMGGLGGGHYVATCKNFLNNKWYKFNDSVVSEISENSIVSGTAYVLFYKRRSGSLRWGGIIPNPNPLPDED